MGRTARRISSIEDVVRSTVRREASLLVLTIRMGNVPATFFGGRGGVLQAASVDASVRHQRGWTNKERAHTVRSQSL